MAIAPMVEPISRLSPAIDLARRGLRIFPVWQPVPANLAAACACRDGSRCRSPGKHPLITGWQTVATVDQVRITAWWRDYPQANIGIATGLASGVIVLDVDPRNGGDTALSELEHRHGALPASWRCLTGGGGCHIFFRHSSIHPIRNSASTLGDGLDLKADGGFVVGAGSRHVSGRPYAWSVDHHPDETPLVSAPTWIFGPPIASTAKAITATSTQWVRLLKDGVAEGRRNDTLARLIGHLLRRDVHVDVVAELARAFNQTHSRPPLADAEVDSVVESIAARELRRRRGGPGLA